MPRCSNLALRASFLAAINNWRTARRRGRSGVMSNRLIRADPMVAPGAVRDWGVAIGGAGTAGPGPTP